MRLARSLALLAILAVALSACASAATPGWTFAPTPTPTVGPSAAPSAAASGAASQVPAASGAPSAAPSGAASAGPSGGTGGAAVTLKLTAAGIAYDTAALEAPANTPFQIVFTNNDAGVPHNVSIHQGSPTGPEVWKGEIFSGVDSRTYDVPALPAGTYGFVCTVHANMTGTLTVK